LTQYVVRIANATRQHAGLRIGMSTRGALALLTAARATALMAGRDYVVPEDFTSNVVPVCAHRLVVSDYAHEADGRAADHIMRQTLESLPSPV
jgi:MoxR-like ATPase